MHENSVGFLCHVANDYFAYAYLEKRCNVKFHNAFCKGGCISISILLRIEWIVESLPTRHFVNESDDCFAKRPKGSVLCEFLDKLIMDITPTKIRFIAQLTKNGFDGFFKFIEFCFFLLTSGARIVSFFVGIEILPSNFCLSRDVRI